LKLAGAQLLGRDAASTISPESETRVRDILESGFQIEELTNQMIVSSTRSDEGHVRRCELLVVKFREGFLNRTWAGTDGINSITAIIMTNRSEPGHNRDDNDNYDRNQYHRGTPQLSHDAPEAAL